MEKEAVQVFVLAEAVMEPETDRSQPRRDNVLATSLAMLVGGMTLFYLYVISLGIVGNVLAVGIAFAMLGGLHYLVWGRAFSAETAAEREMLRRQDDAAMAPHAQGPSNAIQDLQRTHGIQKKSP